MLILAGYDRAVATDPSAAAGRAKKASTIGIADLTLGERVCLALIDGGVDHGWAIGTELSPENELGKVWSLSRPLTYRAIEQLVAKELVRRSAKRPDQGRERMILSCTPAARRLVTTWLDQPVEHIRDVRTELLLKLLLRRRRDMAVEPLLAAQQALFSDRFDALINPGPQAGLVDLWRRENARAVRRFLDAALEHDTGEPAPSTRALMPLSARNQIRARIATITHGDVLSSVKAQLPDGQTVTAVVTRDSVHDLDLAPDDNVLIIVKSTEVMLARSDDNDPTETFRSQRRGGRPSSGEHRASGETRR